MIGLVITCYNRPEYFIRCLGSLKSVKFPANSMIVLVDDASTDEDTIDLFERFHIDGVSIIKKRNTKNSSVSFGLKYGFDKCFESGCDIVTNLDSDAIVKPNFIDRIIELKERFPDRIVTGFNCLTKNANGTERHKIIRAEADVFFKQSVGGINMAVDIHQYSLFMRPALQKNLESGGNWDHMTCINSNEAGLAIVCGAPSVVQHIGYNSSMNHTEAPDVADDFTSLELKNVTLVGIDHNPARLLRVMDISCKDIKYHAVKCLTPKPGGLADTRIITCDPIRSKEEYSEFVIKKLHEHILTDYALIIQYDGYVLNYQAWDNDFLNYDYIGATWWYKDNMNVGNGGFSLRSRRLLKILAEDPHIKMLHPEDHHICRTYRDYLEEKHGIVFAPEEVANRFSIEAAYTPDKKYWGQFGFHGFGIDFSEYKLIEKPEPLLDRKTFLSELPKEIRHHFHKRTRIIKR
jgi:glycosyltransferase involved in cell wall biosynthesis